MSVSTTAFYGLGRDFMARFNAPGYTPWGSLGAVAVPPTSEQIRVEALKEKAREAARRQQDRKNEKQRLARCTVVKTAEEKVLRVNPYSPICEPSGMSVHKAEIRKEMRKTKPASGAN